MNTTPARMREVAAYLWGPEVQHQQAIVPGVVWYETAGHGGMVVSTEQFDLDARLRPGLFNRPVEWVRGGETVLSIVGFEEDVDIMVLIHVHPELAEPVVKRLFTHLTVAELLEHARVATASYRPALLEVAA